MCLCIKASLLLHQDAMCLKSVTSWWKKNKLPQSVCVREPHLRSGKKFKKKQQTCLFCPKWPMKCHKHPELSGFTAVLSGTYNYVSSLQPVVSYKTNQPLAWTIKYPHCFFVMSFRHMFAFSLLLLNTPLSHPQPPEQAHKI